MSRNHPPVTVDELTTGAFLHDIGKLGQRAADGSIRNVVFLPPRGREGEQIPVPMGWMLLFVREIGHG